MLNRRLSHFGIWTRLTLSAIALLAVALLQTIGADSSQAALLNRGFETGDLTNWEVGAETEGVTVLQNDPFTNDITVYPLEGDYMARIGDSQPSAGNPQEPGLNELTQVFQITGPTTTFAYEIWTYDYTGYDYFSIELLATAPSSSAQPSGGGQLFFYEQQAWGSSGDTSLKSSGWRIVTINTAGYEGFDARLTITAGGTQDDFYAFWAYVDSADDIDIDPCDGTNPVCDPVDVSQIQFNGHPPSFNPATGQVHITPTAAATSFDFSAPILCPDGSDPTSVTAILGTSPTTFVSLTKGAGIVWSGTIPLPPGGHGGDTYILTLSIVCPSGTIVITVGPVTLIDPSGFVTDAVTEDPIVSATVTLQRMDPGGWITVNPFETIQGSPTIDPQVNPQSTDGDGHYGWDVIEGTYRVIVEKDGYITQTSPEVTVPPPVLDLNIELVPEGSEPQFVLGDVDCDGDVDSVDALKVLQFVAGIPVAQEDPCEDIGSEVLLEIFGDVDCDDDVDSVDALKILQFIAGLPFSQEPGCRSIGT